MIHRSAQTVSAPPRVLLALVLLPLVACSAVVVDDPAGDDPGTGDVDARPPVTAMIDAGVPVVTFDARPTIDAQTAPDALTLFTPARLPGLALWLEGSYGVGLAVANDVRRWADRSPSGNHATQEDPRLQPLLMGTAINRRPGIYFGNDGTPVSLHVTSPTTSMAGDFTVFMVYRSDLPSNQAATLFRTEASDRTGAELTLAPPQIMASYTIGGSGKAALSPDIGSNDGGAHIAGMRKRGARLEVFADEAYAAVDGAPAGDVSGQLIIGGQLEGAITELVLVEGALSEDDVWRLTVYLRNKYDTPWGR